MKVTKSVQWLVIIHKKRISMRSSVVSEKEDAGQIHI